MDVNFKLIVILVVALLLLVLLVDAWFRERKLQREINTLSHKKEKAEYSIDNLLDTQEGGDLETIYPSLHYDDMQNENTMLHNQAVSMLVNKQNISPSLAKDNFIVINVIAKHGGYFLSYDLLQAISATGLQYGAMNIFHYIEDTPRGKLTLFSLASVTEPGEFDLNNIGGLMCAGLTLFMNVSRVPDPGDVFLLMLETAEQLAEDLDGELRAAPNIPWTEDIFHHYENRIVSQQKLI